MSAKTLISPPSPLVPAFAVVTLSLLRATTSPAVIVMLPPSPSTASALRVPNWPTRPVPLSTATDKESRPLIALEKVSPAARTIFPPAASIVPSLMTSPIPAAAASVMSGTLTPSTSTTMLLPSWPRNTLSPAAITTYPPGLLITPALRTCLPIRATCSAEILP